MHLTKRTKSGKDPREKGNKVANLLQKCFLPKYQVKILNFIDENRDKIQTRTAENEYYKWQTYEILSNKYSLRVTRH